MSSYREVRCAFVVIKLKIDGRDYLVMRRDKGWNDLNLIGGHQEERDNGQFQRTARREMFEELSAFRGKARVTLEPLTKRLSYGPVWSQTARRETIYQLLFFSAQLNIDPRVLEQAFSPRSMNYLVDCSSLKEAVEQGSVSAFVGLLALELPGGLEAVPYSVDCDLGGALDQSVPGQIN